MPSRKDSRFCADCGRMSDADYVRRYCPVRAMTVRMCVPTDCKAFITIDHKDSRRGRQSSGEDS